MPLNKLENFIKNTEGRILYVNPNDLDATDSIENQGNSLTKPFKTIQRAILESARFSYVRGNNNDLVEKTTILLFPGEYIVDNRPGYAIKDVSGTAKAVSPSGAITTASDELSLTLSSNFDLTQSNNILYKFNSITGGVIVPRGTSIVGLDLRKTKIRPKYVPNPTDSNVGSAAIFKITGACYFWQMSFFDGDDIGTVYTDPSDFSAATLVKPTFSHHKLTCFEYADGVTIPSGYDITDLDMYYSKLSNAFNESSGRNIDQKFPSDPLGFAKQRPEWEIVGAFASDPINISTIISGDGFTPGSVITVTTSTPHGLTSNTPIKISGVSVSDYNISTKVQNVISTTSFTYLLSYVRDNLPASPSAASATVTIETDTVSGASPYVFNCSLRSVWGMNGMHADGAKASGFRSMVVAQFTGVSLQKDDRAFVKYNETSRLYDGIPITRETGSALANNSSSTNASTVYHLDSGAIYRSGWESSHIKMTNDAIIQIVSVFAIGYNKHFDAKSGGDASITNSNSNFGQISLSAEGFKKEAFDKDNKAYITSVVTPRAITSSQVEVDWISLSVGLTTQVGISSHLYLYGFNNIDDEPPIITQGYRVGAKVNDKLYVKVGTSTSEAVIRMCDNVVSSGSTFATGTTSSEKSYVVLSGPSSNIFTLGSHNFQTGEKVRIISGNGDLPENIDPNVIYYAIRYSASEVKLASSKTNADNGTGISVYGGSQLTIVSRVSDKSPGEIGHPVQWDSVNSNWFIHTDQNNQIYNAFKTQGVANLTVRSNVSYIKRNDDSRSLDEKLYKIRIVIPKELQNAKTPTEGFVIQESSTTGARTNSDFTLTSITNADYLYNRNPRFISTCTVSSNTVTAVADLPHNLKVGDNVIVKNVTSTTNPSATVNVGFNGTFTVTAIPTDKTFQYSTTDVNGIVHNVGSFTNNTNLRTTALPRFERNNNQSNLYIYRSEVITPYIYNVQDGIYYIYVLNSSNAIPTEFTSLKYSQNVVDLYPQLDKDNTNDNPSSAITFAKRDPLGDVVTNDLRNSITRESIDKVLQTFGSGLTISSVTPRITGVSTITFDREHGLAGIVTYSTLTGGSGYTNGTFYNVKLYNDIGLTTWDGATAKVVVSGGAVTGVDMISGGSGYTSGETLYFDTTSIGGGSSAQLTIATSGITSCIGNGIQITGIGTTTGGYYRIYGMPDKNKISIAQTTGDPQPISGQYVINLGITPVVTSSTYDSTSGISTFTCSPAHGLVAGNRFRILDSSNNHLGDYLVKEKISATQFSASTNASLSAKYIIRGGLAANNATADSSGENLGTRGLPIYENDSLVLLSSITTETSLPVQVVNSGIATTKRFPLGSYIQVDNEIMRISTSTLSGAGNNEIGVIRGALGTGIENHSSGSLVRRIKPIGVEFRRNSILRASGHTFEYLGFGPGNYSTGLPQIQNRTLTERETFLVQSQEKSGGIVVYTGMNNDGDFFNGNTKTISSSGKVVSYDIPNPTVTGQDPSRLSVIFDEVIVKERLLVEGGNSGTVLSQFDGPVTFNKELKINDNVIMNNPVKINNTLEVTNTTQSTSKDTGAVIIDGGVGIEKNVYVGGNENVTGTLSVTAAATFGSTVGITSNTTIGGTLSVTSNATIGGNLGVTGNTTLTGTLTVNGGSGGTALQLNNGGDIVLYNGSNTGTATLFCDTNNELRTNNNVYIGGELNVVGDITAYYTSDQRLKENITPIADPLAKVMAISGNTFDWVQGAAHEGSDVGVIAQEILKVLPEAVTTRETGYLAVRYEKIVPLLIEAIKDLSEKVSVLEGKLNQ